MQNVKVPFKKGAALQRDWTEGSIIGNLWSLSWPMTVSSLLLNIGPTIDMIWVGKLGSTAIAGVGVSGLVVMVGIESDADKIRFGRAVTPHQ